MIRDISLSILKKLPSFSVTKNEINTRITQLFKAIKNFLKQNLNVLTKHLNKNRRRKENIIIALNNNDYKSKVLQILEDKKIYIKLKKDPINKLINDVRDMLLRWKKNNFINDLMYKKIIFF